MRAEIGGERGEGDGAELRDDQRFGGAEGFGQLPMHRLLDEAGGIVVPEPQANEAWGAEREVDIGEGDGVEGLRHFPAAAMPLGGTHEPSLAEAGHGAAHDDWVCTHAERKLLRRHRAGVMGHVQQGMQHGGEAIIGFHVTLYVT